MPLLGYLVVGMMGFLLVLSVFRGRYWCWNLCPRGAFLDGVLSKVSPKRPLPGFFTKQWFRWTVFGVFMAFLALRLISGGNYLAIGAVFVSMCLATTLISIILGLTMRHRGWCAICPMGTLQEKLHKK